MDKYIRHDRFEDTTMNDPDPDSLEISQAQPLKETSYLFNSSLYNILKFDKQTNSLVMKCTTCFKCIKGNSHSTGNFISYIKKVHSAKMKVWNEEKLKFQNSKVDNQSGLNSTKQLSLVDSFNRQGTKTSEKLSQKEVNYLILNYIVEEMLPVSTIDKESFRTMIERFLSVRNNPYTIFCRKSLMQLLTNEYNTVKCNLMKILNNQKYVCTTADIWSSNNKSYMGMTVHFIDKIKIERCSFMLACKRIKYSHNFENIGKLIYEIHTENNLNVEKITHTITDNASNFSKAFKVFNDTNTNTIVPQKEPNILLTVGDTEILMNEWDDDEEEIESSNEENLIINNVEVQELHIDMYNEFDDITLPNQIRCLSHTLNLLAVSDSNKAKSNNSYKDLYDDAFDKAHTFWNLLRRSTKALDVVKDIVQCKFPIPVITRWNSFYNSVNKLLQYKSCLNNIFQKLNIPRLKTKEIEFFEEYVRIMEPIAISLDIFQGEKNCFLGVVLPTLFIMSDKISHLKHCQHLKDTILNNFKIRFSYIIDLEKESSKTFIISAISHPKFKLSWIPNE
ncbi:unnamed protein product [Macrosiphum euphorbiae]|uniref:Transposase n=1 Tax=Macrosiphum euphorbiae TaxID=13131 RepID=A0AAV0WN52_9HEMI|nr:unnamed protein product [Macrosiphum euphorbiae]